MPTNIERFEADIAKIQKQVPVTATSVYRDLCLEVIEAAVAGNPQYSCPGTPVDTGFARGSWMVSIGKPARDGPTNPNTDATGTVDTSPVFRATIGQTVWVTSFVAYMSKLEYEGHSGQAPRGFVRLAISAGKHMLRDILKREKR